MIIKNEIIHIETKLEFKIKNKKKYKIKVI